MLYLTDDFRHALNGASLTAVEQLQEHIDAFIAIYNETAEQFVWEGGARRSTWGLNRG